MEPRVRAVLAVDDHLEAGEVGAEALVDVREVRVGRDFDVLDPTLVDAGRRNEELLDLLLRPIRELATFRVEELDAVVLRRVVRRGDDDAEIQRQQRDRGVGRTPPRMQSPPTETTPRANASSSATPDARVSRPTKTFAAPVHMRSRTPEPLDELGREELAHDAADTVGAEVPPSHEARGPTAC